MILIADGGSTKTDWCLVDQNNKETFFSSEGFNPYYIHEDYIAKTLSPLLPVSVNPMEIDKVYFYGAGCSENKYEFMKRAIKRLFKNADIHIAMDLHAAARALLGKQKGFAAILGTGTNSCLYNGCNITMNIDSLGFFLGDEGSGSYMGKLLLRDYLRNLLPENVKVLFEEYTPLRADEIMDEVYTKPFANRFCAQFSKFISLNMTKDEYFYLLVKNAFKDLFEKIISHYPDYYSYKFNCIGSVGYYYRNILSEVAKEWNMEMGTIKISPLKGLIRYHTKIKE